jgi:hypothetical protein
VLGPAARSLSDLVTARLGRVAVVTALAVGLLAVPALPDRLGAAAPPPAELGEHRLTGWSGPDDAGWRTADPVEAPDTVLAGVVWEDGAVEAEVRPIRDGETGHWVAFHTHASHGPDAAPRPELTGGAAASDPVWLGSSDAVQVRVRTQTAPRARLQTVAMAETATLARGGARAAAAHATEGRPDIIRRADWDPAGECRPTEAPEIAPSVHMAHIHHTVMYPRYGPDDALDVVRALCVFHVELRGWQDLGYNFLIDRYGTIYEGRAGGIERPVVASHAAGFNAVSFGVSVVGDFETHRVPPDTLDAIEELLAWKFDHHGINPLGLAKVVSTGGARPGLTDFEEGEEVILPTILGHRDTGRATLCPGRHLYAAMEGIEERVADRMRAAGATVGEAGEIDEAPPPDEDLAEGEDHTAEPDVGSATDEIGPVTPTEADVAAAPGVPAEVEDLPATGWGAALTSIGALGLAVIHGGPLLRRRRRSGRG